MIGSGLPVYQGYSSQFGFGLGNILGGILRSAIPMITPIAKNAGRELLLAGVKRLQRKKPATKRKMPPPVTTRKRKRSRRDIFK